MGRNKVQGATGRLRHRVIWQGGMPSATYAFMSMRKKKTSEGRRKASALAVILAMLLPLLLAVAPAQASSGLDADLMLSRCQPADGADAPALPHHGADDACCILCPMGTPLASLPDAEAGIPVPGAGIDLVLAGAELAMPAAGAPTPFAARAPPVT